MPSLFRRIAALLIVTAYVSAVMLPLAPRAAATPAETSGGMMHHKSSSTDRMPCHGAALPCQTALGCIFLVGLPALPGPTIVTLTAWTSVRYAAMLRLLRGLTVKPALGPPIAIA